jgi:hypothetical protein
LLQYNIKLFETIKEDTGISWWDENRRKINEVIKMCNDWQIEHRQDRYYAELTLARINSIKAWSSDQDNRELSGWQIEILDEIEEHIREVLSDND